MDRISSDQISVKNAKEREAQTIYKRQEKKTHTEDLNSPQ